MKTIIVLGIILAVICISIFFLRLFNKYIGKESEKKLFKNLIRFCYIQISLLALMMISLAYEQIKSPIPTNEFLNHCIVPSLLIVLMILFINSFRKRIHNNEIERK